MRSMLSGLVGVCSIGTKMVFIIASPVTDFRTSRRSIRRVLSQQGSPHSTTGKTLTNSILGLDLAAMCDCVCVLIIDGH